MSEEIKAAVERVRAFEADSPNWTRMPAEVARARADLAREYLREHPADSDEPLTEEWLRSVGGDRINHPCGFWAFSFTGEAAGDTVIVTLANSAAKGWRWGFGIDTIKFTTDGTRGAWRNVCGILGIPLTEPGAS